MNIEKQISEMPIDAYSKIDCDSSTVSYGREVNSTLQAPYWPLDYNCNGDWHEQKSKIKREDRD